MRYRDASGGRRPESTNTEDWDEAQRRLRDRLHARDNRTLEVMRRGEQLTFQAWTDSFIENYSKPPIRAAKTHEANERATKHLRAGEYQPAANEAKGFDTVLIRFEAESGIWNGCSIQKCFRMKSPSNVGA